MEHKLSERKFVFLIIGVKHTFTWKTMKHTRRPTSWKTMKHIWNLWKNILLFQKAPLRGARVAEMEHKLSEHKFVFLIIGVKHTFSKKYSKMNMFPKWAAMRPKWTSSRPKMHIFWRLSWWWHPFWSKPIFFDKFYFYIFRLFVPEEFVSVLVFGPLFWSLLLAAIPFAPPPHPPHIAPTSPFIPINPHRAPEHH